MGQLSYDEGRELRETQRKSLSEARAEIRQLVKEYNLPRHVAAIFYVAGANFSKRHIRQRMRSRAGGMYGEEYWEEHYLEVGFSDDELTKLTQKIERKPKPAPTST